MENELTPQQKVRLQLERIMAQDAKTRNHKRKNFESAIKPVWIGKNGTLKMLGQEPTSTFSSMPNLHYGSGEEMRPIPVGAGGRMSVDSKSYLQNEVDNRPVITLEIIKKWAFKSFGVFDKKAEVKIKSNPVTPNLVVGIDVTGNALSDEFSINPSYTLDSNGEAIIQISAQKSPWELDTTRQLNLAPSLSTTYQSKSIVTVEMPFIVFWGYGQGMRVNRGSSPITSSPMSDLTSDLVNPTKWGNSPPSLFKQPVRSNYELTGFYTDSYILPKPNYSDAPTGTIVYPLTNPANLPARANLPANIDSLNIPDGYVDDWNDPAIPPAPVWYDTNNDGIEDVAYQWWDTYSVDAIVTCGVSVDNTAVTFATKNHYTHGSDGYEYLWSAYSDRQFTLTSSVIGDHLLAPVGAWFKCDFPALYYFDTYVGDKPIWTTRTNAITNIGSIFHISY